MHYAWPSRWLRNTYAFYLSIVDLYKNNYYTDSREVKWE